MPDTQVLLSGSGPINFNAGIVLKNAPKLARQNIVSIPTIVENNAKSVVGERLAVNPAGMFLYYLHKGLG